MSMNDTEIKQAVEKANCVEGKRPECERAKRTVGCRDCEINAARVLLVLVEENGRLRQERYDALSVTSKDGLLSSEWILRTGKAERERNEAQADVRRLTEERDAARGEAERLRDKYAGVVEAATAIRERYNGQTMRGDVLVEFMRLCAALFALGANHIADESKMVECKNDNGNVVESRPCDTCGGYAGIPSTKPDDCGERKCPDCNGTGSCIVANDEGVADCPPLQRQREGVKMHTENWNGEIERKQFHTREELAEAAQAAIADPNIKKIIIKFPKPKIPGRKSSNGSGKGE